MSDKTKVIIITSNTDLIQQFQTNENLQTEIINFDDQQQTDRNQFNLAFLAQLFQQNSTNDQNMERALNSNRDNETKRSKSIRKSSEKKCLICGDQAIGYNYDVLSCTSCKAFFYRTANHDLNKLRCSRGDNRCSISFEIHRKCQKCRLRKCFDVGMRKDFLLSEKEKQRRKNLIEQKRNLQSTTNETNQLLNDFENNFDENLIEDQIDLNIFEDNCLDKLSIDEWILTENIRSIFLSIFKKDLTRDSIGNTTDHTDALIFWSHVVQNVCMNFIEFFRQIEHFEGLNNDDRFLLIKYNIGSLYPILKSYYYHPIFNSFDSENDERVKQSLQFYRFCFNSNDIDINEIYANLVLSLVEITKQDPIFISLFFIVYLFSQRIIAYESEQPLKDPSTIFQIQCFYTNILWKYLVNKQGQIQTIRTFDKLIRILFQMKTLGKFVFNYFNNHLQSADSVDQLAPLFQSILHIS